MGAILRASDERESRLDVVDKDFEGGGTTTSSDSNAEEEGYVFGAMPTSRGLQRSVEVAPGFVKRTDGVNLDYESTFAERMRKCAKLDEQLDEQLEGLRALLPHSSRKRERNDSSVVMDAYRYIVALQQEVEDLNSELRLECEEDSCDQERTFKSHHSEILSDQQPLVEVMKRDGVMEVRIVCANRPGLLVDVMEAVESRGLTVAHARIACNSDNIDFKYLARRSKNQQPYHRQRKGDLEEADGEEELDIVKAMLVDVICDVSLR